LGSVTARTLDQVRLRSVATGSLVDIEATGWDNGTPALLWPDTGNPNQAFAARMKQNGAYTFTARHSSRCLDVAWVSGEPGEGLQQFDCHDGANQSFIVYGFAGAVVLVAEHSGLCLQPTGREAGDQLVQENCTGDLIQRFQVEETHRPEFALSGGNFACPEGFAVLSPAMADQHRDLLCGMLGEWHIARLGGGGRMNGPGYGCEVRHEADDEQLGHTLCVR
jgi:hypothetical protein